jgi:hypothetical protein
MPATPVFILDLDTVKAQLRLSAVDTGDASAVLDATMGEVRVGLYHKLGSSLVAELVAIPPGDPATTADELRRLLAENVEYLWVRMILMQRLPMLFMQSAGVTRHAWNEEGITREASGSDIRRALRELEQQVQQGIAILTGLASDGGITATVILPDETPPRPGDSILPTVQGGTL